jgi:hypothetical protein
LSSKSGLFSPSILDLVLWQFLPSFMFLQKPSSPCKNYCFCLQRGWI